MTPQPARPRTRRSFWDRRAAGFDLDVKPDDEAVAAARRLLGPDAQVLEIGCAVGATARALRPRVASWHAIDLSAEMVELARAEGGDITYQQTTIDGAPEGPFDAVVAFNVLHFMDLDTDLQEIRRRLRPGGLLLAQTPCLGDMNPFFRGVMPVIAVVIRLKGLRRLRFGRLRAAVVAAGFEVMEERAGPPTQTWLVARRPADGAA
ncbi:MAG: class I SAM-dependent methyltransferase [Thermoplasmatota archaeon]